MVGIDAHEVLVLVVEAEGAKVHLLQLVLVEVRPAPDAGVDDVGEAFAAGNLEYNDVLVILKVIQA